MQSTEKKRSENETAANWIAGIFGGAPLWILIILIGFIFYLNWSSANTEFLKDGEVDVGPAGNQGYLYRVDRTEEGGSGWRSR